MKLTFFLIAIALIVLRLSYPSLEIWHNKRGQGTMISKGDNYIQGIWWSGKYRLSNDDRSIAELSPGGYLKYRENDTTMKAESDLEGKISYTLYNGHEQLPLNDSGRNFLAAQLQKMIRLGFFADERADRIYRQGGFAALLSELSRIKMDGSRDPYLQPLLHSDSLTASQQVALLRLIDHSNDGSGRQHDLEFFSRVQLRDSTVAHEWLSAVGHLDESYMKKDLLLRYLRPDSSAGNPMPAAQFDTVLAITGRFGSSVDEQEIYKRLADLPAKTDDEWAALIRSTGTLDADYLKSELLLRIAPNMPRTDSLRAAYRMAAKSIREDQDYGKVMRAIE